MHPCIRASMHPCIRASKDACMHACIHALMCPCIHASMHPYIHALMCPCIHAYMHPSMPPDGASSLPVDSPCFGNEGGLGAASLRPVHPFYKRFLFSHAYDFKPCLAQAHAGMACVLQMCERMHTGINTRALRACNGGMVSVGSGHGYVCQCTSCNTLLRSNSLFGTHCSNKPTNNK